MTDDLEKIAEDILLGLPNEEEEFVPAGGIEEDDEPVVKIKKDRTKRGELIFRDKDILVGKKYHGKKIQRKLEESLELEPGTISISAKLKDTELGLEARKLIIHGHNAVTKEDIIKVYNENVFNKDEREEAKEDEDVFTAKELKRLLVRTLGNEKHRHDIQDALGIPRT